MSIRQYKWDFVIVGEFFFDIILSGFHSLPKLGEESFARRYTREVGGGAATTACGLAKLGSRVAVLGVLGGEDHKWICARLKSKGVHTDYLEIDPKEPTGLTVSVSTREDRAFFSYYGANEMLAQRLRGRDWFDIMKQARIVHFACAPDGEMDRTLLPRLRRAGCRLSIDVQSHLGWLTRAESLNILRAADMFFPNEREAEWVSGETGANRILRALRDKGVHGVGLKLGGKGAALAWKKREFVCDSYPVETIDTTGAGDCFNAGFLHAWSKNQTPQRCLEIANICGALSTRSLGGIKSFPGQRELDEALED